MKERIRKLFPDPYMLKFASASKKASKKRELVEAIKRELYALFF